MIRYLSISSDDDVRRLQAAAWRAFYHHRRLVDWDAYRQLPDSELPPSYVRAGRPLPQDGEALDWLHRTGEWVWQTMACPKLEVEPATGGGGVVLLSARPGQVPVLEQLVVGGASLQTLSDGDLAAIEATSNLTWLEGLSFGQQPAQRARLQLGHEVFVTGAGLTRLTSSQPVGLLTSDFRERGQLSGRFEVAMAAREARERAARDAARAAPAAR